MSMDDVPEDGPAMLPEKYFLGETKAWGVFVDRFGKFRRQFQVDIVGEREGDLLTLTEDFVYADGERSQRIWEITLLGEGRYEGRAGDVVGVAKGEAKGSALHWEYDLNLPIGERVWQVHFDDWMLLQDDKVMINRATVTKFGFALGEVILFFQKAAASDVALDADPKTDAVGGMASSSSAATARTF